jgi:hypothetical protein
MNPAVTPYRFILALLTVVALCHSVRTSAFSIYWPVRVHQDITEEALEPMTVLISINPQTTVGFSRTAIQIITDHNVATDKFQGFEHSEKHFDNDHFERGSRRLIQLRKDVVTLLVHPSFGDPNDATSLTESLVRAQEARELMGEALHTLQDFYAHSNWVERSAFSSSEIDHRLGVKPIPDPPPSANCNASDPAAAELTSAWSDGVDGNGLCVAPDNKCAHGYSGFLGCDGINKDSGAQTVPQSYVAAFFQARLTTYEFVRNTLQEVLDAWPLLSNGLGEVLARNATRLAVCQFMGVPDAINTCLTKNTLTVQKINRSGGGAVTQGLVQSSSGNITPAIDCGSVCQGTAIAGTQIQLTASDTGNWKFVKWAAGGACAGSPHKQCNFTVSGNLLAKAEFAYFDAVLGLDPKAFFLRSVPQDQPSNPLIINLNEFGILPGQVIELSSSGFYYAVEDQTLEDRQINMVFSSSNELLSPVEMHRVPGALHASAYELITPPACYGGYSLPNDIPEDFSVASFNPFAESTPVVVTVPEGALYLFAGVWDCYVGDNTDPNGDLVIAIRRVGSNQAQFVDWSSINHGSRIASGLLGQTNVTFQWTADGGVSATWFNQNLHGFSSSAFTPALESTDGLEFRARKLPDPTPTYTITFSAPVLNPLLHIASNASTLTFVGATPTYVSGDERFLVSGSQVIGSDYNEPNGTDANGTVRFWGLFTSLTFTAQYSGTGAEDGVTLQVGKDAP